MNEAVFLYGTLLPELATAQLQPALRRLRRIGRASVPGRLYDLGEFPGAVLDAESGARIQGEIFFLSDESILSRLDLYEEFDPANPEQSPFVRVRTFVTLEDGTAIECWIYVYNRDPKDAHLLTNGDYVRYLHSQRKVRN